MRDIVEKYQYYMTEAARLLELVNEQDAYITKLEEALDALSESKGHGEEHGAEKSEEEAQHALDNIDRIMAEIMPGKAKNRRGLDLTPEALKLKAQEDLER